MTTTCTTGDSGTCTVTRNNIGSGVISLTIEVTDVVKDGYLYNPAANDVTSITLNKPQ